MVRLKYILMVFLLVQCSTANFSDKSSAKQLLNGKKYKEFEKLYQIAVKVRKYGDKYLLNNNNQIHIFDCIVRKNKNRMKVIKHFFFRDLNRGYFNYYIVKRVILYKIPGWQIFKREILNNPRVKNEDKKVTMRIEKLYKGIATKYNQKLINFFLHEDSFEGIYRRLLPKKYPFYFSHQIF